MRSAPRVAWARELAVPRPQVAVTNEVLATVAVLALLLAALLAP